LVSGAAAAVLGLHPDWTADQVKGALMLSATKLPSATNWSGGVGELNFKTAVAVTNTPNPNLPLNAYLVNDSQGSPTRVFNGDQWIADVTQALSPTTSSSNASWGSASWGSAAWGSAAWGSAAWGSAAWGSASWGSAAWGSSAWSAAAWGSASWG